MLFKTPFIMSNFNKAQTEKAFEQEKEKEKEIK